MKLRHGALALAAALTIAGCATPHPPAPDDYDEPALPAPPAEAPPLEPVEPLLLSGAAPTAGGSQAPADAAPAKAEAAPALAMTRPTTLPPPPVVPPEPSADELAMSALLADLQRYAAMPNEETRREIGAVTQLLGKQRTDANRVRLAMLYTMTRNGPQDDQRALQLLDNVAKSGPGLPAVKQLALVLQAQISERVRAVHDEQQKADVAIQKLEALRSMERSLLRDRVRGGGGSGGGGGSSGGGGSGGGSGGGAGG